MPVFYPSYCIAFGSIYVCDCELVQKVCIISVCSDYIECVLCYLFKLNVNIYELKKKMDKRIRRG